MRRTKAAAPTPERLVAVVCRFCGGDGIGNQGYGPLGDQCVRCFDAAPILGQTGWCMTTSAAVAGCPAQWWRELTAVELAAWNEYNAARRAQWDEPPGPARLVIPRP